MMPLVIAIFNTHGYDETGLKRCIYITALTKCTNVQYYYINVCNNFIFLYSSVCLMFIWTSVHDVYVSLK